jgi:DUF4097 and DUF4098 domain-containing protein YvlB
MNRRKNSTVLSIGILALGLTLGAASIEKVEKSFPAKKTVRLEMVSGDCVIRGGGSKIEVRVSYDFPRDKFTPEFKDQGDTLILSEKFSGGSCHGSSSWEITLPADAVVVFASASGNVDAQGLKNGFKGRTASGTIRLSSISGRVDVRTASGDADLTRVNGEISVKSASGEITIEELSTEDGDFSTASGDVRLRNLQGGFQASSASGSIKGEGLTLNRTSQFKSASGDVQIKLSAAPKADITLVSASGDATLDFNGQTLTGSFEMTARKGRPLVAPFSFDTEEEFEKNGETYVKKMAVRQAAAPKFVIKSASGKVEVK